MVVRSISFKDGPKEILKDAMMLTADFTVPHYRDGSIEAMLPGVGVVLLAFVVTAAKPAAKPESDSSW